MEGRGQGHEWGGGGEMVWERIKEVKDVQEKAE